MPMLMPRGCWPFTPQPIPAPNASLNSELELMLPVMSGSGRRPVSALVWMLLSVCFFSFTALAARVCGATLPAVQVVFLQHCFGLLVMLPFAAFFYGFDHILTGRMRLHLLRAMLNVVGVALWYTALVRLQMATAQALNFTHPLFMTLGGALLLRETVSRRQWGAVLLGFVGVLVLARPFSADMGAGADVLLPLGAALCWTGADLLARKLTTTEHAGTMTFYMILLPLPVAAIPAIGAWIPPNPAVWQWAVMLGGSYAVAQFALARALSLSSASALQPLNYLRLPIIAGLAFLALGQVPDIWTWVGAAVMIGASLCIKRSRAY
jgi:drug/metabolite transporter (DMT)-like permease